MKKTNIAFSGFMAAILIGAGAANAATVKIASQQYVDTKVGDVSTTVSNLSGQVETLGTELDSKLDTTTADSTYEKVANKKGTIDSASPTASTDYPTVQAVVDYTAQELADVQFDPADISDGALSGSKITNGTISADKLDTALNAEIDGKQDKKMGVGHENHIVTTDETGTITSVAAIEQSQVTGLTDALAGKASTADIPTAVSELTNDSGYLTNADMTGYAKTTDLDAKQNKNIGADHSGKILTVGADGNITTSATIDQARVAGLTDALAAKVDDTELTTINQTIEQIEQNVTNITTPDSGLLAKKEDSANKKNSITPENKSSDTYFPTIGAITSWVSSEISDLSELPVNPGLIEDGTLAGSKLQNGAITSEKIAASAVTTEKIADNAVTSDKLSDDVVAEIDAKADLSAVYTRQQTNDKIVEIAIQQPQNTCTSESDLCVLTLTKDKKLAWVPVTDPATAPVDAGPVMGSKNTDTTVD